MERRQTWLRLIGAFVIGFAGLALEIAYTRIISFKLFYYYTYFVIGLSLLGLGAGSTVVALSARLRRADSLALLRRGAPIAAVAGLVSYLAVARLATDTNLIWIGSGREAVGQVARLLMLSLSLTTVFFALGVLLSSLIVVEAHAVRRIYFWDMTGAALGALLAVPLQAAFGPPTMVFLAMVLLGGLSLVVSFSTGSHRIESGVLSAAVLAAVLVATSVDIRTDAVKTLKETDVVVAGGWGPVFRVDAVDLGELQILNHDGLWGSSIWRYDGTPATTDRFATDNRRVPWAALGRDPERLLIIGAAGGNEVMGALTYGVGQVDAVELNPLTVDMLRNEFAEYTSNFIDDPRVNYVQGDGRTFLARSADSYDLVWFVAPDSYAASNAATSGAFVLSESYLYTESMVREAFDHLTDEGMMVVQFGDFDFAERPTRTARYLATARQALSDRTERFADHVMLLVDDAEWEVGRVSTIVIAKSPLTSEAIAGVEAVLGELPATRAVYLPGVAEAESVTTDLIVGTDAEVDQLIDGYGYDISPVTDDRPFFWHFTPYGDVITDWSRDFEGSEIAIGERLLLVLFTLGVLVAGVMLFLPFAITKRRGAGGTVAVRGRWELFAYFASIGLGFMLVEISMIQRFALLLGYPTLSLSVSLFTLLVATAVGARISGVIGRFGRNGLPIATAALWLVTLLYLLISDPITEAALGWSEPLRIALVIVLLFPVGLLLGLFLPNGIDAATATAARQPGVDEGRLVAWCWAVNGFFSVLGSSLTTMLSMSFGFDRTVMVGLLFYIVPALVFLRRTSATPAAAVGTAAVN
jgi:hypothetical protein